MSIKKTEIIHIPEGYIRVHGINIKIEVAIAIANSVKENLIQMRQDPKYESAKGRDYMRTLEDKIDTIFREVRKIKEKK